MTGERTVVGLVLPPGDDRPPGLEPAEDLAELRVVRTPSELVARAADAEVLLVWEFRENVLEPVWSELEGSLRWIHAASAGVDAIVFPGLARSGVVVTNSRGVLDEAIAEWVLAVLLAFAKDLPGTLELQRQRRWAHRETERLAGRRVLVVGAGSVGRAVARLCRAVGMTVEGIARTPRAGDGDFDRVGGPADLPDRLAATDVVVVCAPLTPDTRGLLGRAELDALRPGAWLVNVGRGPVVDEGALLAALGSGHVARAALDVFAEEPLAADHPLWTTGGVVVSAHMAGDFVGWQEAFSALFVDNLGRWRRGEALRNVVDVAAAAAGGGPSRGRGRP